jgi:ATP-dependent exoDNAse (exonuclease V) alpha subunit
MSSEASMVSSAQLARFVAAVDQAGAKLVLVGDPEQLQPLMRAPPSGRWRIASALRSSSFTK